MRVRNVPMYVYITSVFFLIVLLSSALSMALDYMQYRRDLPLLLTSFRSELIGGYLSAVYTRDQGWDELETELEHMISLDYLGEQDAHIRLVVHDVEGKMLLNSFETLSTVGNSALIKGDRCEIRDLEALEAVGSVTLYISADYIDAESRKYLTSLLTSLLWREVVTAGIAVLILAIMSRRITRPLSELQHAMTAVASGEQKEIIPSGSSETTSLGESFNEMSGELERQRGLRRQLMADLAHDLNGPLHAIRLEARSLKDGITTVDEATRGMIGSIDSLSGLVYDLEYLSEADCGEIRLNLRALDLRMVLSTVERQWRSAAAIGAKSLSCRLPEGEAGTVLMDEVRMRRAVGNLIQNAIRYNRSGKHVVISGSIEQDLCRIEVCDDGEPIPALLREKIFERFYRGDTSRGSLTPGNGLGLSIVRQIAQLHGGDVKLESREGVGNCFIIEFPTQPPV